MTFSPYQLELLGDFYRSNFSVSRFAQEKGIARITFWRWVRIFEDSNPEISAYMKKHKSPKSSEESSSITALRAELKDAKMRAHAFDTMIDVAEEMFNLPIRKKAGTKQ